MSNWTTADIPSQQGRSVVITGTGGLGFENALALARAGGEIIIAGRNPQKGADAVANIGKKVPLANVQFEQVDLASIESIAAFGERLRSQRAHLDLLINNAAVMTPPERQETSDGIELQFGTNYLGHFALTAELLPLLRKGTNPRVVTLSSIAARNGAINFDDLQMQHNYKPMVAYSQSKLACLIFAFELQRRSAEGQWGIASIAAHPGISRTNLLHNAPGRWSAIGIVRSVLWFMFQPAAQGALPTLFSATSPAVKAGTYYGPDKMGEMRGYPIAAKIPPQALDINVSKHLWAISEELTGLKYSSIISTG